MFQPIIDQTFPVEVQMSQISVGSVINFPNTPQLNDKWIYGIQTFTSSQMAASPNQRAVVTSANAAGLLVTLVVGEDEQVYKYPYLDFNSATVSGLIRILKERKLTIVKCYVTVVAAGTLATTDSMIFNFIYKK